MGIFQYLLDKVGPDGAYPYGRRMIRRGRYADALEAFAQAEKQYAERLGARHPRAVDAMAQRGFCLVALGRFSDGVNVYERALAAKIDNGDSTQPTQADLERLIADAKARQLAQP